MSQSIPVVDLARMTQSGPERRAVADAIGRACREHGFFYIVGHGVDEALQNDLEAASRRFFEQDLDAKMTIAMARGGRAWRGYFPVGAELTSGQPDLKEGIYFGQELDAGHPSVRAGVPMHGPNLFPEDPPELRPLVLDYMNRMTALGHAVMRAVALSLELDEHYFANTWMSDPFTLFRIFNYPPPSGDAAPGAPSPWGVGAHTDYGVLTILKQDDAGGLEIKSRGAWIPAPPVPGSFVCNIGDMLDRMTGGLYRSTLHRARNKAPRARLSFPFFFDPNFDAEVSRLPLNGALAAEAAGPSRAEERWDKEDIHRFEGRYGDYLLKKVGRVFPDLGQSVLPGDAM